MKPQRVNYTAEVRNLEPVSHEALHHKKFFNSIPEIKKKNLYLELLFN